MNKLALYYHEFIQRLEISWQRSWGQKELGIYTIVALIFSANFEVIDEILSLPDSIYSTKLGWSSLGLIKLIESVPVSGTGWLLLSPLLALIIVLFVIFVLVVRGIAVAAVIAGSKRALTGEKARASELKSVGILNWSRIICLEWEYYLINILIASVLGLIMIGGALVPGIGSIFVIIGMLILFAVMIWAMMSSPFAQRFVIFFGYSLTSAIKKSIYLVRSHFFESFANTLLLGIIYGLLSLSVGLLSLVFPLIMIGMKNYIFPLVWVMPGVSTVVGILTIFEIVLVNLWAQSFLFTLTQLFYTHLFVDLINKE